MSASIRRYIESLEQREFNRGYTEEENRAATLRKKFLRKYIINFDTNLYKTQVERDWAYIAQREYRYDVLLSSIGNGFFWGNVAWSLRIWMLKRFVIWPLPVIGGLAAMYLYPQRLQKHNKKLFDMCNVGEQYFLGRVRNEVLRECNKILDREDF